MQPPPRRLKANPTLRTLHEIERVLRAAARNDEPPLSLRDIRLRLRVTTHSPNVITAAIDEFVRRGVATVGPRGVQWLTVPDGTT
ncbi:MAG: hypothetical protein V4510_03315 [bacterium]